MPIAWLALAHAAVDTPGLTLRASPIPEAFWKRFTTTVWLREEWKKCCWSSMGNRVSRSKYKPFTCSLMLIKILLFRVIYERVRGPDHSMVERMQIVPFLFYHGTGAVRWGTQLRSSGFTFPSLQGNLLVSLFSRYRRSGLIRRVFLGSMTFRLRV